MALAPARSDACGQTTDQSRSPGGAKRKIDRPPRDDQPAQGVIGWDVAVTKQRGELCASYEILTLVAKRNAG